MELVRLILVALFAVGAWRIAQEVGGPDEFRILLGIVLGSAVGYVIGGVLGRRAHVAVSAVERDFAKVPASELLAGAIGLIPGNGTLLVRRAVGGHQDMPETESVFVRADDTDDPENPALNTPLFWPIGGRTEGNTDPGKRWSLGELLWLDDPACDRGDVELEAYLPADEVIHAVFGAVVRTCRVCGLPAPTRECLACVIAEEAAAKRWADQ